MKGYRLPNGGVTFVKRDSIGSFLDLPCGQCIGCRIDYSRDWAIRCMHEASTWKHNCFITLTYNDENLPPDGSLNPDDFQKFMKRFRKKYRGIEPREDENGKITYPIRYFHCGEYGEKLGRPHYHALLFNFEFPDLIPWKVRNGIQTYLSPSLERIWGKGWIEIGSATWQSAAYVARYMLKKHKGEGKDDFYTRPQTNSAFDPDTGEILETRHLLPEYTTMSRKPAIGRYWYDRYGIHDIWHVGQVVVRKPDGGTFSARVPRYYQEILRVQDEAKFNAFKRRNIEKMQKRHNDNSFERLEAREICAQERTKQLPRNLDKELKNDS